MTRNSSMELLIQRCVDDELSAGETQQLLRQLDSINGGWKCLACGLLEDRQLRQVLGPAEFPSSISAPASDLPTLRDPRIHTHASVSRGGKGMPAPTHPTSPQLPAARLRHWWNHPVTSLSLCAAIAFVGGMLVSGDADQRLAGLGGTAETAAAIASKPAFSVQLPGGKGADRIPVYEDIDELRRSSENHPFLQNSGNQGPLRVLLMQAADGRTIAVPIDDSRHQSIQ